MVEWFSEWFSTAGVVEWFITVYIAALIAYFIWWVIDGEPLSGM